MGMYFFLFGVIVPAAVTLALFIAFLICWFKCDMKQRFTNRRKRKRAPPSSAPSRIPHRPDALGGRDSVYPGQTLDTGDNVYKADMVYSIMSQSHMQVKLPLDSGFNLQRKASVESVHLYETLDSLNTTCDSYYNTIRAQQPIPPPPPPWQLPV